MWWRIGIAALLLSGLLLAIGLVWGLGSHHPEPARAAGVASVADGPAYYARFVGAKVCGECHPGEVASHSRSGHAHTLREAARIPLARRLDGRSVADPERPGVSWAYRLRDGDFGVDRLEGEKSEHFPIRYAFGSGKHAVTFVSTSEPAGEMEGLEHRLSFYASTGAMGLTPSQEAGADPGGSVVSTSGRILKGKALFKCFDCHTTMTSDQGPDRLDLAKMIRNISCERCHGPGREHVEAARRGTGDLEMLLGPGHTRADAEIRSCGECHRHPDWVDPRYIRLDSQVTVRFQPVGMMQSRCYLGSNESLRCTSCHDPHARTSRDQASYEAVCLNCHGAPSKPICPVSPKEGCIPCHMPRRGDKELIFTDHWIRVVRPEEGKSKGRGPISATRGR